MTERRSLAACVDEVGALIGMPACPCGRALPLDMVPAVDHKGRMLCGVCEAEQLAARTARYAAPCRHHDAHLELGLGLVCDDCGEVVER